MTLDIQRSPTEGARDPHRSRTGPGRADRAGDLRAGPGQLGVIAARPLEGWRWMVIRRAAERPEFWPYPAKPRDRATASDGAQPRRPPRPLPVPRWPWHDSPRATHTEQDHRSAPFSLCRSARSSAESAGRMWVSASSAASVRDPPLGAAEPLRPHGARRSPIGPICALGSRAHACRIPRTRSRR